MASDGTCFKTFLLVLQIVNACTIRQIFLQCSLLVTISSFTVCYGSCCRYHLKESEVFLNFLRWTLGHSCCCCCWWLLPGFMPFSWHRDVLEAAFLVCSDIYSIASTQVESSLVFGGVIVISSQEKVRILGLWTIYRP